MDFCSSNLTVIQIPPTHTGKEVHTGRPIVGEHILHPLMRCCFNVQQQLQTCIELENKATSNIQLKVNKPDPGTALTCSHAAIKYEQINERLQVHLPAAVCITCVLPHVLGIFCIVHLHVVANEHQSGKSENICRCEFSRGTLCPDDATQQR